MRIASKISWRSSVPTTSGPSARYSSASLATWARPISWISWAVLRGGREVAQRAFVGVLAVGEPAQAAPLLRPGDRQRLVTQGVAEPLEAGADRALQRGGERVAERVGVDALGRLHRGHDRVVGGRCREHTLDLGHGLADRERGTGPPSGRTLAHPLGQLLVVATDGLDLGRHRVGDVLVGDGEQPHHQAQGDLRAVDRVGGQLGEPRLGVVGEAARGRGEHPARQRLLLVEPVLAEPVGAIGEVAQGGDQPVLRVTRGVLEARHVGVVAEHVALGRLMVEECLPVVVGQLPEFVAHPMILPR